MTMTNAQMNHFLNDVRRNLPKEKARREADPTGKIAIFETTDRGPDGRLQRHKGTVIAHNAAGLTCKDDESGERVFFPWHMIRRLSWEAPQAAREEVKPPS